MNPRRRRHQKRRRAMRDRVAWMTWALKDLRRLNAAMAAAIARGELKIVDASNPGQVPE